MAGTRSSLRKETEEGVQVSGGGEQGAPLKVFDLAAFFRFGLVFDLRREPNDLPALRHQALRHGAAKISGSFAVQQVEIGPVFHP